MCLIISPLCFLLFGCGAFLKKNYGVYFPVFVGTVEPEPEPNEQEKEQKQQEDEVVDEDPDIPVISIPNVVIRTKAQYEKKKKLEEEAKADEDNTQNDGAANTEGTDNEGGNEVEVVVAQESTTLPTNAIKS